MALCAGLQGNSIGADIGTFATKTYKNQILGGPVQGGNTNPTTKFQINNTLQSKQRYKAPHNNSMYHSN